MADENKPTPPPTTPSKQPAPTPAPIKPAVDLSNEFRKGGEPKQQAKPIKK